MRGCTTVPGNMRGALLEKLIDVSGSRERAIQAARALFRYHSNALKFYEDNDEKWDYHFVVRNNIQSIIRDLEGMK